MVDFDLNNMLYNKIGIDRDTADEIYTCQRCNLHKYRKYIVIGKGEVPADILFMGEAPGRSENVCGLPFEGITGTFLHKRMLRQATRLAKRNLGKRIFKIPSFYITNTIMCRPCDSLQGGNRKPKPHEVLACKPNLLKVIQQVDPKIVVFVGKESLKYYKDEFVEYAHIQHPSFLVRTGGQGSSHYNQNIIILADVIEKLIREEHGLH